MLVTLAVVAVVWLLGIVVVVALGVAAHDGDEVEALVRGEDLGAVPASLERAMLRPPTG